MVDGGVRVPGQVLTVLAARGGSGRTTLAANLAVLLTAAGTRRVCLVDLDLDHGDLAVTLSLPQCRSIVDLGRRRAPVDADAVASVVEPVGPCLDALTAPSELDWAEYVSPELVGELLAVLADRYDHVVVDTPTTFSGHVLQALDASQDHLLVSTPERPALYALRTTLDVLDLLGHQVRSRPVVLNRCHSWGDLDPAQVRGILRGEVAARLPATPDVPASVNEGRPLTRSRPHHLFSVAVARFVHEHLTASQGGGPAPQ
jgi:MinD-like ATPase involved in chromosome partitioning or flagellar assembly